MIHLAVETSTEVVDMSLLSEDKVLVRLSVFRPGGASEILVQGLETLLAMAGEKKESIALVSSSAGPGTYTSIRVGHLFCKGLAFATGCPHLVVSPFLVLAEQAWASGGRGEEFLVVLLDARRREVNACLFDPSKPAAPVSGTGETFSGRAVPPERVLENLPPGKGRIVGPGVVHLEKMDLGREHPLLIHDLPGAGTMGRLAIRSWRAREEGDVPGSTLLYGRDSVIA
ncbi:MAG: tRNA (adenosine(37)-N6)-threonylcarbamoyltransferase complex dimerization subunit type 1 TsaB [Nitrospirae bacterium]|nr:MAG: putative glycoprotein endopeptidase [Leptospirillum sp. Group IV 'UBA BS']MCL4484934.1 tRNA (adenosine(37)-N6)-threonylcarbamoyltransferase complex dimerization subunit type 1 TsaB [Nitrospirota bacterium]MCL5284711.1 tRNA (adenosine(37)-N6)-threonylcarbamoyltransferase complex dimerization subunit type 1 TsaB [Nitrospirota bacterium]